MPKFSDELIKRLQTYFAAHYGQELTVEQADLYLDSLASLFLAVWNHRKDQNRHAVLAGADGQPAAGGGRPP